VLILTLFPPALPNSPAREAWAGALPVGPVRVDVPVEDSPKLPETAFDTVWETRGWI